MLVWEWTDQDFLPGEQVINSKHWASEGERQTVVGEQWDFPPRSIPRDVPIGLLGGHQCGAPSDFANGEEWPYTGDPVEYDEDWVPLCCPRYYGLTVGAHPDSDVTSGPVQAWGADCCSAPTAAFGTTYNVILGATGGGETLDAWFRWNVTVSTATVTLTGLAGFPINRAEIYNGLNCLTVGQIAVESVPGSFAFSGLVLGTLCIRMRAFIIAPVPVSVRVDAP